MKRLILFLLLLPIFKIVKAQPDPYPFSLVFKIIDEKGKALTLENGNYHIILQTFVQKKNSNADDSLLNLIEFTSNEYEMTILKENSYLNHYFSYLKSDSCFSLNGSSVRTVDEIIIKMNCNEKHIKFLIRNFDSFGYLCFDLDSIKNETYLLDVGRGNYRNSTIKLRSYDGEIYNWTPVNGWKWNIYKPD